MTEISTTSNTTKKENKAKSIIVENGKEDVNVKREKKKRKKKDQVNIFTDPQQSGPVKKVINWSKGDELFIFFFLTW